MTAISASAVKELREKSGAGMMDCKKALAENNGDVEAAMDWLRTKGLAKAAKKADRAAAEGLVAVVSGDKQAAIIELNAETDFVSRNEQFQDAVEKIANVALTTSGELDAIKATDVDGKPVSEFVTDLIASIGENMELRRTAKMTVDDGVVATYVHSALKPGMGKIGVLVALESAGDKAALEALGKQIAMHIAATRPASTRVDDLDQELVERERNVLIEQARESGKPEEIIQKMIEGRIRKYYEEVVLLEQTFVVDGERKVSKVIEDAAKEAGAPVTLKGFTRFELGDGVEKEEGDFAAEVAAAVNG